MLAGLTFLTTVGCSFWNLSLNDAFDSVTIKHSLARTALGVELTPLTLADKSHHGDAVITIITQITHIRFVTCCLSSQKLSQKAVNIY